MQALFESLRSIKINPRQYFQDFQFSENFRFTTRYIKGDIIGGLTSAIVAMPLALGFGILAFNGRPEGAIAGLYGAIFTGILASLFGGTRQQITGPTGGMTVVLTTVYINYGGAEALLTACIIAGVLQIGYGILKLGKYVSLVPYPVTVGFTNGIAALIFLQQLPTFSAAPIIAIITMMTIYLIPKVSKSLPKSLIGLIVGTSVAYFFSSVDFFRLQIPSDTLSVTVGSAITTIGEIPASPFLSLGQ
jgi:SulP family sulfate permease